MKGEDAQKQLFQQIIVDAKLESLDTDDMVQVIWDAKKNNTPRDHSMYVLWMSDEAQQWQFSGQTVLFTVPESEQPPLNLKVARRVHVTNYLMFVKSVRFVHEERQDDAIRYFVNLTVAL